jgi:small GTP-binding protein
MDDDVMQGDEEGEEQHLQFKILFVGEAGVGKTSIVNRYSTGIFTQFYKATIGCDFASKQIRWNDKTEIMLQLWDLAGQERFGTQVNVWFRDTDAIIYVYDITDVKSKDSIQKWKALIEDKAKRRDGSDCNAPSILVANKVDLLKGEERPLNDTIDIEARSQGHKAGFMTSAVTNENLDEAVKLLIIHMLEIQKSTFKHKDDESLKLTSDIVIATKQPTSYCGGRC